MAAVSTFVAVGFGALGAVQQQKQQKQAKKAAAAQRRAATAQAKAEEIKAVRARKQSIREAAIKRAQIVAGAGAAGLQETSGAIGGIGSIGSQLGGTFQTGAALQEQANIAGISLNQASVFGQKASQAGSNAAAFGDIAGLAFSAGSRIDSGLDKAFGTGQEGGFTFSDVRTAF